MDVLPAVGRADGAVTGSAANRRSEPGTTRWQARPVAAAALRGVSIAVPMVLATLAVVVIDGTVGLPSATLGVVELVVLDAVIGVAVVSAVERLARRLLPLATLLSLSVPDIAAK